MRREVREVAVVANDNPATELAGVQEANDDKLVKFQKRCYKEKHPEHADKKEKKRARWNMINNRQHAEQQ